jgi:post-segregation antitoxin (ccd killing protein)
MRMARVNISLPDEIYRQAKDAGLNVSQLARRAILQELSDRAKIAAAYEYLDELEAELGPISAEERALARAWADDIYSAEPKRRSA